MLTSDGEECSALNLSFAHANRGFWLGATQAMEKTLILAPEPARTIRLYLCWMDYFGN